jgi:YegS/Rv2252/BmrU family lipid kinase
MSRKIVYVVNPVSGTRPKSTLESVISRENDQRNISFEIICSNAEGDYRYLIQKITRESITDVVVCGGDGSVNAVAAALINQDVNLGIIPMGSGNGLALSAKIPVSITGALEVIFGGKASYIDGFFVNEQFSCMLCGIGFDAKVAHDFAKQKRRGLQTYIKVAAINYFSAVPYLFELRSLGKSFSFEAYFISVSNSNQFGNNFTIAPMASLSDGLLDVVIVKKMSKFVLPFSLLSQVTGINAKHDLDHDLSARNIIYFQASALSIVNHDLAPFHIDGDPKNTSAVLNLR